MGTLRLAFAIGTLAAAAVTASPALAASPPGYHRVFLTPTLIPPSASGTNGFAPCPTGTVPWGGGTGFSGGFAGTGEDINSSAPAPARNGWNARYNNRSTRTNDHFTVEAICAARPAGYTVRSVSVDNPAGTQTAATVACPTGTVLLGGGSSSTGTTTDLQVLSAFPLGAHRYRAVMWNGSGADQQLRAWAICAKQPPGYRIVSQTGTGFPVPETDVGGSLCPSNARITGGGVHVAMPRPLVTLGASFSDSGDQWVSEAVNLDTTTAATVTIVAICAV